MVRFNLHANPNNPYSRLLDPMRLTPSRKRCFRRILLLLLCLFPSSLPAQPFNLINITNTVARDITDQGKRIGSGSNTKRERKRETNLTSTHVIQKDGKEMVLIRAGWFEMGSTEKQIDAAYQLGKKYNKDTKRAWFKSETPRHRVWVDAYYMDKTEVTNREFRQFMDAGGYKQKNYWSAEGWKFIQQKKIVEPRYWKNSGFNQPNQPVVGVSWYEAEAYASWAGKQLPTEAQWEKAARGSDGRVYTWGNEAADGNRANYCDAKCGYAWKDKGENDRYMYLSPVGSYELGKSPYGIYDLAGNVWEWVRDWYDGDYYSRSPERNPVNDKTTQHRVLRGGGWGNIPALLRTAYRNKVALKTRSGDVGFRCVVLEKKIAGVNP